MNSKPYLLAVKIPPIYPPLNFSQECWRLNSFIILSMPGEIFNRQYIEMLFLFFLEVDFDISTGDSLQEISNPILWGK